MRGLVLAAIAVLLASAVAAVPAHGAVPGAHLTVEAASAKVGDRLPARIVVELPAGATFEAPDLGSSLGKFSVFSGAWSGPTSSEAGQTWQWNGFLAAFETGELEVPALALRATTQDGPIELSTEPLALSVTSVLEAPDAAADTLADIKPPLSLPPEYRALWIGLAIFVALLGASLLLWWLHRRYAARLAAAAIPEDPFRRERPHEWVYRELQRLLDRRLAEQGQVDEFYAELSQILKRYLEGRYRVDLLEHTTSEVGRRLEQAGTPQTMVEAATQALDRADRVKFARERPGPEAWRLEVEALYDIVDKTKPAEVREPAADRGAA